MSEAAHAALAYAQRRFLEDGWSLQDVWAWTYTRAATFAWLLSPVRIVRWYLWGMRRA
jgi:hypothetical protein